MAGTIVCPVCGEINPADMEFCRNCQSRLKPLEGALQGEGASIQPGELPTKKTTAELEPLLPQWLREARQQARDSATEDLTKKPSPADEAPASSGPDLLAGLASQKNEEEDDIPEWLAQLTGAQARKKKAVPEESQVKWVELGRGEEPPQSAAGREGNVPPAAPAPQPQRTERDELADWFKQAAASSETADFPLPPAPETGFVRDAPEETRPLRKPEDAGWLKGEAPAPAQPEQPPREEAPDWLKKMQAEKVAQETPKSAASTTPPFQGEVPDWLKSFEQETPDQAPVEPPSAPQPTRPSEPLPDWLKDQGPFIDEQAPAGPAPEETIAAEMPDWLASLGKSPEVAPEEPQAGAPASAAEELPATALPGWIGGLEKPPAPAREEREPGPPQSSVEEPSTPAPVAPTETPDWMASLRQEAEATQAPPEPGTAPTETPDWMASLRQEAEATQAPPEPGVAPAETPDWMASLRQAAEAAPALSEPGVTPTETEQPAEPALTDKPLPGNDVDAIFASMKAPDWLASVLPGEAETGPGTPPAAPPEEPIAPAELPSWVQAMRPVESAISTAAGPEEEIATEQLGPLAGLRGVLPALPGAAVPSSKPRPQSLKLDANEQQQAQAALLEQILAAETSPIPMKSAGALLRTQKALRWFISALLVVVLGAVVYTRTQVFQLPAGVPNETLGAIQAVEAVPADAPVLAVFDYQPSTVGEMEASGGSLLDHLLLLKHPKLVLLSTSPTGAALAERFLSTTLADRAYERNVQYVNLGYLPGGLAGVYKFAQSPRATIPLDMDAKPAWDTAILGPVERFSDFAAILVLTDSLESGRTWIEQTQTARGNTPMVIVASAQAGPMLLPYFESGQVSGILSGIYGAVAAEQRNAGSPGLVRRYWDAYSVGLYLAVALITLGALWNLWRGIQERRAGTVG